MEAVTYAIYIQYAVIYNLEMFYVIKKAFFSNMDVLKKQQ